jgi:hypothetical protein
MKWFVHRLRQQPKQFIQSASFESAAFVRNTLATVKSTGISRPVDEHESKETERSEERLKYPSSYHTVVIRSTEEKDLISF